MPRLDFTSADIVQSMTLDPSQVRRWMANFDAAKEVERDLVQKEGPRQTWSIETALSLIAAAEQTLGSFTTDPVREQQDEAVRVIWDRLRKRHGHAA